ncbi:MAG TPA: DUF992 domain-containing protein, partial [Hyphomicrobiaceae bacterium]|nr:DUF992 domain-containing protein [Hyphomicrobiaceae bacterium]
MARSGKIAAAVTALLVVTLAQVGTRAQAPGPRVEIGVLTCTVAGGPGLILGSQKDMGCIFKRSDGSQERYDGRLTRVGVDIGITTTTVISWGVLAPTNLPAGALSGTYTGVTAEATIGAGLGANVLLGGSSRSIALQPVSVQAQQGL